MKNRARLFVFCSILAASLTAIAQISPSVRYLHDEAGNLLGVVGSNGNATIYDWDARGQVVGIQRMTARSPVDLFFIIPTREDVGVSPGTAVTIHGVGFSSVPAENQVTFNEVAAVVDASTMVAIQTRIPAGARTGPVQVTSPLGSAFSRTPYKINNCVSPPAGLVSWWTLDGHARDALGRNPGDGRGAATFAPGIDVLGFSLNGTRGDVYIGHRSTLDLGSGDFSVGFWMKTAAANAQAILNKRDGCPGLGGFWGIRMTNNGRLQAEVAGIGSFSYEILSASPANDGNWHHVALVRQGASARLYLDGQLSGSVDTKDVLVVNNTGPMLIGSDPCIDVEPTRFYSGVIDEVELFNRVLSTADMQAIISARDSGTCRP